uniref:ARAD1C06380p n=1 Tax=Blastobotrys adeninivorans TaxID=409370 RepID=A0A060T0C3_BLAAD
MSEDGDFRGWVLTVASALTCVAGSLVICVDVIWRALRPKSNFTVRDSRPMLVASLSISAGIMLFTSMYRLLPEAKHYFKDTPGTSEKQANIYLIVVYLGGIVVCSLINMVIHALTAQSVVHCAHDVEHTDPESHGHGLLGPSHTRGHSHDHSHNHSHDHSHHHSHDHAHSHSNGSHGSEADVDESSPLLGRKSSLGLLDLADKTIRGRKSVGKCMGYASAEECALFNALKERASHEGIEPQRFVHDVEMAVEEAHSAAGRTKPPTDRADQDSMGHDQIDQAEGANQDFKEFHHHHVSTRYSHIFSIGLQTAVAISVHKIPEGFITFATSHASKQLGFQVFLALAIHNFSEGFTIAYPLYLALGSRCISIAVAFVLGGLSQPLGALLAWGLFKEGGHTISDNANMTFGIIVALTAGFMSIIGLQMYGAAITYGQNQATSLAYAFFGIALVGFTYILN